MVLRLWKKRKPLDFHVPLSTGFLGAFYWPLQWVRSGNEDAVCSPIHRFSCDIWQNLNFNQPNDANFKKNLPGKFSLVFYSIFSDFYVFLNLNLWIVKPGYRFIDSGINKPVISIGLLVKTGFWPCQIWNLNLNQILTDITDIREFYKNRWGSVFGWYRYFNPSA
jgi:hypothetical protein